MPTWNDNRSHRPSRNGSANRHVREDDDGTPLIREHVAQLEARLKQLTESYDVADRLIMPWERFMDGDRLLFPSGFPTDRQAGRNWPTITTEQDLRQARAFCRLIADTNSLVIAFLDHVTNFVVKTGFKWQATLRGQKKATAYGAATDPDIEACQQVLDDFRQLAGWGDDAGFTVGEFDDDDYSPQVNLEHEGWRRAMRDGEFFLRLFRGGADTNGIPTCRVVEPECVKCPNGDMQGPYSWGILTDQDDIQRRKAFWVTSKDDGVQGEQVPAGRMLQLKLNVDGDIKRGLPDFWPLQDEVQGAQKLWRNTLEVNAILAAIAYIRQHAPGVTGTQVNSMLANRSTDGQNLLKNTYPYTVADRGTDRTNLYTRSEAGQVIEISNGMQYQPGPSATGTAGQIEAMQAIFRIVGIRWGCPEYFSGDASSANFASTLVSGGPFEIACVTRQGHYKRFQGELAKRVLILACESGRLRRDQVMKCEIKVTPPAVAIANRAEDTQRRSTLAQNAGLSKTTWLMEEGYDPDQEAANVAAEAMKAAAQQQPPAGPGGPGAPVLAGPGGGTPSPLTSGPDAGGGDVDLSTLLGEGRRVSESRTRLLHEIDPPDGFLPDGTAFYLEDRSGLVKKVITNKHGHKQTVYVRASSTDDHAAADKTNSERADSRTAVATAVGQLDRLTMSQFHRLDIHIAALSRDEIRGHLKALGEKIGGAKVELAKRLLEKVRAAHATTEPAVQPRPEPAVDATPKVKASPAKVKAALDNIKARGSDAAGVESVLSKLSDADRSAVAEKLGVPVGDAKSMAARIAPPKVEYQGKAADFVREMFGGLPSDSDLGAVGMAGSFPGEKVEVHAHSGGMTVHVSNGDATGSIRHLYRDDDTGQIVVKNESFHPPLSTRGSGSGTAAFAAQVAALQKMGVSRIETFATRRDQAGSASYEQPENGYYTWPRLGYDGPIGPEKMATLPPDLKAQMGGSDMVSGLYKTQAGRDWWKANGEDIDLSFDLSPGSASVKALEAYQHERKAKRDGATAGGGAGPTQKTGNAVAAGGRSGDSVQVPSGGNGDSQAVGSGGNGSAGRGLGDPASPAGTNFTGTAANGVKYVNGVPQKSAADSGKSDVFPLATDAGKGSITGVGPQSATPKPETNPMSNLTPLQVLSASLIKPEVVAQKRRDLTTLLAPDSPLRAEYTADVEAMEKRLADEAPVRAERDRLNGVLKSKGIMPSKYKSGEFVRKTTSGWSPIKASEVEKILADSAPAPQPATPDTEGPKMAEENPDAGTT